MLLIYEIYDVAFRNILTKHPTVFISRRHPRCAGRSVAINMSWRQRLLSVIRFLNEETELERNVQRQLQGDTKLNAGNLAGSNWWEDVCTKVDCNKLGGWQGQTGAGAKQEVKSGAAVSVMAAADDLRGLQDRLIRLEREETTDRKAGEFAPSLRLWSTGYFIKSVKLNMLAFLLD